MTPAAEKARHWRAAHPDEARAIAKRYRHRNAVAISERNRRWELANREKRRASCRRYAAANPHKRSASNRAYRARSGERTTTRLLRTLKPEDSIFRVFIPLDARGSDWNPVLNDRDHLSPLELLMQKEELLEMAA